jgi:hypothetical protein
MRARPFQAGNSYGVGRPKGARNKLARRFLEDCLADWQEHGAAAIKVMRRDTRPKKVPRLDRLCASAGCPRSLAHPAAR